MLQGRTYVPMLHARLAEMRALRELPNVTKNKLFPIIKARPWLNAQSLSRLWETISQAFPDRWYALDLDRTRFDPDDERQSYIEFAALFDPQGAYENYYERVQQLDRAVPVLRYDASEPLQLDGQLEWIEGLDRGAAVRILSRTPGPLAEIAAEIAAREIENVVYVVDGGWGRDLLLQAAQCTGLVETVLQTNEDAEVVIGGSSFPDSFVNLGERFHTQILERTLFREVRRNVNRGNLFYGDWGSTRPPTDPVPMRNVPRIDIPVGASWLSWRSDEGENYEAVAQRAVDDDEWSGELGIWGEYMIESTSEGLVPAVGSPAMAAAVRVNMHLHYQANIETPDDLIVDDEPFEEDL